jgi:hypothetical protein
MTNTEVLLAGIDGSTAYGLASQPPTSTGSVSSPPPPARSMASHIDRVGRVDGAGPFPA